ncbi:MAG: glycosyltransferase [Syntrophobacteraceae bacterium]
MKILIISDAYPPEIRSSSHLMQELAEELKERGHSVTVVTCQPRYNLAEAASSAPYEELTVEEGVRVIRVHTLPHHKVNFLLRGISQLTLPIIFWRRARQYIKEGLDAVLVYRPPFLCGE